MSDKEHQEWQELTDRSCDALVLAYSPTQPLGQDFGKNFYIPSDHDIETAFGVSLRRILGAQENPTHWADTVKFSRVRNLHALEKRILEGTQEILGGVFESQNLFEMYMDGFSPRFEHAWIYRKGDLYRFTDGKRKEALQKFQEYWSETERVQWTQIHHFMRKATLAEFKQKTSG